MTEQEFAELAAGHALHALSAADEQALAAALAEHPEWDVHVVADATVVARLAELIPDAAPPVGALDAIFARIDAAGLAAPAEPVSAAGAAEPSAVAADPAAVESSAVAAEPAPAATAPDSAAAPAAPSRRASRGLRTWFALAASIALLLGVGAGATLVVQHLNRPAAVVALDRIESSPDAQQASAEVTGGGDATLHWSVDVGEAVLVADDLPAISSDQTFELWYVRGGTPVSAGTFDPSSGTTSTVLEPGMQPGDVIAVTVEPAGGSPTGTPSGDPIVAIQTA